MTNNLIALNGINGFADGYNAARGSGGTIYYNDDLNVKNFTATWVETGIQLSWTNPTFVDFDKVQVFMYIDSEAQLGNYDGGLCIYAGTGSSYLVSNVQLLCNCIKNLNTEKAYYFRVVAQSKNAGNRCIYTTY